MVFADALNDWSFGEVIIWMLYFMFLFIWIWLFISVAVDVFRSHDLSGWAKAIWVVAIIIFPVLGVLIYLIARGDKMAKHGVEAAREQDAAAQAYIRQAAGVGTSHADQLVQLSELKSQGVIDDAEFARLKAKVIDS